MPRRLGLGVSRLVAACACLAFVLLSMVLLWDGSVWSLLGWLIALTPMVLFVTSIINPNGLEIASSLAFAAAVPRVVRDPARVSTWVGVALSAAGAVGGDTELVPRPRVRGRRPWAG